MRVVLGLALSLLACTPGTDVVARFIDEAADDGGKSNGGANIENASVACTSSNVFAVLTKPNEIRRFDLLTQQIVGGGPVTCPIDVPGHIAVDSSGVVWTTSDGKLAMLDPGSSACKVMPTPLVASALGFAWDANNQRDWLYAVVEDSLQKIDQFTGSLKPIGKMALTDVRGLVGTNEGTLYAFAGDQTVTVAAVAIDDASVKLLGQVKSPAPTAGFVGGGPFEGRYGLFFGNEAYTFQAATLVLTLQTSVFPQDPGVLAVAAPPCLAATK
jgi:hypothetical protein